VGIVLTGFADQSVRVGVQEEVQEDDGGEPRVAGSRISQWSTPVALGIGAGLLGAGLGTHRPGLARTGRDALVAMGVAGLLTTTANIVVGRAHPQANEGTDYFAPFSSPSRNNSFPSGQTSRAFAFAAAVAAHTRHPALRVAAYGAATVVGIAQVVADRHFASDVVAGAVLGTLVGRGVVHRFATAAPRVGLSVIAVPGHMSIALRRSF
jgi:membrane-associated phospholipid phosphatase